jgi:RP/EB family microtubule-associated protein
MMGESRQELLNWVNDLLQLNYTKIEQMGTGIYYLSKHTYMYIHIQNYTVYVHIHIIYHTYI